MELKDSNTAKIGCLLCRAPEARFSFSKHGYSFYRCSECDFLFVHPMPDDTSSIYDASYFGGARHGFGYVNYDEDKIAMRPFFDAVLDAIEKEKPSRGSLLDVGAATGFFLRISANRGWTASGLEISPYAVKRANDGGLAVIQGSLETAPWQGPMFDVITMLDVIEHVVDPRAFLDRASSLLKPGGVIAINTPDAGSVWANVFGKHWHAIAPPEHLGYFNRVNLKKFLRDVGFETIHEARLGKHFTPSYVVSMAGRWVGSRALLKLTAWLESSVMNRLYLPINIRDNMFILARVKRSDS